MVNSHRNTITMVAELMATPEARTIERLPV